MVRGRRRRGSRYTWLPTLGGIKDNGSGSRYGTSYFGGDIAVDSAAFGSTDLYVTPIVPDATVFPDGSGAGGETLRDFTEGQDWLCKRVVGKLSVGAAQIASGLTPPYIIVGAGIFAGRADDQNQNIPDTNNDEIDPLGSENVRQPWMWRRTFLLTNASSTFASEFYWTHLDNGSFGVLADTQTVDTKGVSRRIRREQRLWFVLNAYGMSNFEATNDSTWLTKGHIHFLFDYRVLGAMRKSQNKSVF